MIFFPFLMRKEIAKGLSLTLKKVASTLCNCTLPLPRVHVFHIFSISLSTTLRIRPNGTVFVLAGELENVTTTHKIAPKRGDIVTFSYSHLSPATGLPLAVRMLRVRRDITWEHVVERAQEDDADEKLENSMH
jgi:hypothetical protein